MTDAPKSSADLETEVAHLKAMLASAPTIISRTTLDGRVLYLNRVAPGFTLEAVLGTSTDDYVPPEYVATQRAARERCVATRETQTFSTVGRISHDRFGHYVTQLSPILDGDVVTSLVMVATDVTELVETMEQLRESQMRLQVALDATRMGTWHVDGETQSGHWDDMTRKIFGVGEPIPAPELMPLLTERIHPEDRERVAGEVQRGLASGSYGPIEHRIVLPDGSVRWVSASGKALESKTGSRRLIGSVVDITERRALEARLLEAEKMESIGRLAGGVAHDFNNMLAAMLINADVALRATRDAEMTSLLLEIKVAAERSAALTAQLLAFARRQVIEPQIVSPSQIIQRLEPLLRRAIGEHIAVSLTPSAGGHVRVDPSQLEQVFLNLAMNARDAMPGGGELRIETRDVALAAEEARETGVVPGPYVVVRVTDTGHGIAPEVLPHIFEPFFTTRPGGIGLGLATCYGIAKQNSGHISVESRAGQTVFSLFLPARPQGAPSEGAVGSGVDSAHGGERVLVVEDEELVRRAVERTLAAGGYAVRCVADPREAIEVFEREGPFHLLVTDLVMPHLSGVELADRLTRARPDLRVLLMSGYSEAPERSLAALPTRRFLQKPFRPQDLLATVRAVLDG